MKSFISTVFINILVLSCHSRKNHYSVGDFSTALQPYLIKVLSTGMVGFDKATEYVQKNATDNELKKLSQSEHPILRAVAFREMLHRESFDPFEIIMNNLDDTAVVATDEGEWGTGFTMISDDIIQSGKWKDSAQKNKTIYKVITGHNYLRAAYTILRKVPVNETYYPHIKLMVQGSLKYDESYGEQDFRYVEYALYALAEYRKPGDIMLIKDKLLPNSWRMSSLSFQLMQNFPHPEYQSVLEDYYQHKFYRGPCAANRYESTVAFFNCVASYRTSESKAILFGCLTHKPFVFCSMDTSSLKQALAYAILDNKCDLYSPLVRMVKAFEEPYTQKQKDAAKASVIAAPIDSDGPINRW